MFSICKLSHPATGVEHAISCHFFNKNEKSLVVTAANNVKIFRLIPDVERSKHEKLSGIFEFTRKEINVYTSLVL